MKLDFIKKELIFLKKSDLYRTLKVIESAQDREVIIEGKKVLLFCSNNYLGLANHPKVVDAAIRAIEEYGFGSAASRLISGTSKLHQELEETIAEFKGAEKAIVFPTGYMTNVGVITSLVEKEDVVIIDKLSHASIIDACYQSKASIRVYPHKNVSGLEKILKQVVKYRRKLIITDSVFSMDGDIAPLGEIVSIAKKYKAMTMVDEAHATGVWGRKRRGVIEQLNLEGEIDIVMGTLSKGIGAIGGYVSGDESLIDYLKNKARSFIYTTSLPPACAAAAKEAFKIIQSAEGKSLQQKIKKNILKLKKGLKNLDYDTMGSETQIVPVLIGDSALALKVSKALLERKIFIPAVRFPTVAKNKSRLRITVMATHTDKDIDYLLEQMAEMKKKFFK